MTLETYIKQHESLLDQLRSYNKPVDEIDQVLSFLQGLPERFNILRTMLLQNKDLKYKDVLETLRSVEASMPRAPESTSGGAAAYSIRDSRQKRISS